MIIIVKIFQTVLISLLVTIACVPLGILIAKKSKLIDYPGSAQHKHHDRPMPMAGGIILMIALALGGTILKVWKMPFVAPAFLAGIVIFIFGLWDDLRDISPFLKLFGQFLGVVFVMQLGVVVQIFESPDFFVHLPGQLARFLDVMVTVFWVLGITNAFNFVDSMDGLTVGIGGLVSGFLLVAALATDKSELAVYCAVLLGACIGLYLFNTRPAWIFLGDAGAQTIGFLLAVLAIVYISNNEKQITSWMSTLILFGVPLFDMVLVITSRWQRKQPIYLSARDHVYHRLRMLGFSPNRSVLLMHIFTLILGGLVIVLLNSSPLAVTLTFFGVIICGIGLLLFFEKSYKDPLIRSK